MIFESFALRVISMGIDRRVQPETVVPPVIYGKKIIVWETSFLSGKDIFIC